MPSNNILGFLILLLASSTVFGSEDAVRESVARNLDPLASLSESDLQRHWSDEKTLLNENLKTFIEHKVSVSMSFGRKIVFKRSFSCYKRILAVD